MDTRHLVDPAIAPLLDLLPKLDLEPSRLPELRAMPGTAGLPPGEPQPGIETVERVVPGAVGDPDVRLILSRPKVADSEAPALLWVHGGGYVLGSAEMNTPLCENLAAELGCVVVSVDYRLAPETRHPGPLEDCYAALAWVYHHAAELGVDKERVAIAGESAGGGLVASLAQLVRDRGEVSVCLQALIYPMIDDRTATETDPSPFTGQFVWTRSDNAFAWACLLGHEPGLPEAAPYAAAARTEDLSGLAPTFLAVGALDLFVDENLAYAHRLLRAGVPTEVHVQPGAVHGYLAMSFLPASTVLQAWLITALRRAYALSGAGPTLS